MKTSRLTVKGPLILILIISVFLASQALSAAGEGYTTSDAIRDLSDPERWVRRSAVEILSGIDDLRVPAAMGAAMKDEDGFVRRKAIAYLRKHGGVEMATVFYAALDDDDHSVRTTAARALGEWKPAGAFRHLVQALDSRDSSLRIAAVQSLGKIGDNRALPELLKILEDENAVARKTAEEVLREWDRDSAARTLGALLELGGRKRQRLAAKGLGMIGARESAPLLAAAVRNGEDGMRSAAAEALGRVGGAEEIDTLLKALNDPDVEVREKAVFSLGEIGGERAVNGLLAFLKSEDREERFLPVSALGKAGDRRAVEPLIHLLRGAGDRQRAGIARALGEIGDPSAAEALTKLLEHDQGMVRSAAAWALGEVRGGVTGLLKRLNDPVPEVRKDAALALGRIGDPRAINPLKITFLRDKESRAVAGDGLSHFKTREVARFFIESLGGRGLGRAAQQSLAAMGDVAEGPLIEAVTKGDDKTAAAAIVVLVRIGSTGAGEALRVALHHPDSLVRLEATRGLAALKYGGAAEDLTRYSRKGLKPYERAEAAKALGEIGDRDTVDALLAALKDEKGEVRTAAAMALGKIGDTEAVPALRESLGDRVHTVRKAAVVALEKLTAEKISLKEHFGERKAFYSHPPYAAGECTVCHDSHTAREGVPLRKPAKELCFGCHKDLGSRIQGSDNRHEPVEADQCSACHNAHGSNYPTLLRAYFAEEFYREYERGLYELCWRCHNRALLETRRTTTVTGFRNGNRNLHTVHVVQKKGRSCKSCHQAHASNQAMLAPPSHCGGGWKLPIQLTLKENGGNCVVGCHREMNYDRVKPINYRNNVW